MTDKSSLDSFCESLQSLRPASDQIDERQVFFAAGVESARQAEQRPATVSAVPMLAAIFAAAIITAPLAFRAGQMATAPIGETAGEIAGETAGEIAGETAGEIAGEIAGETVAETVTERTSPTETHLPAEPLSPMNVAIDVDPQRTPPEVDQQPPPNTSAQPATFAFAHWLAWDAMVAATQIERESNRTLTAGHAALVTRDQAESLNAYPFSLSHGLPAGHSVGTPRTDDELAVRPLTLGNQTLTVLSPESSR